MIYRFRIILDNDTDDDVFRDVEIRKTDTLEDLHNVITQSFGFDGSEMASFYISDKNWSQGEEISLFDVNEESNGVRLMSETLIEDIVDENNTKLIYVYDFFSMWTFLVELGEIVDATEGHDYPNLMFVHGQIPSEAPKKHFQSESTEENLEYGEDLDVDDYDALDFDENWN